METPANALGEIHTESKSAQMILYERYINHRYLYMNPAHLSRPIDDLVPQSLYTWSRNSPA